MSRARGDPLALLTSKGHSTSKVIQTNVFDERQLSRTTVVRDRSDD